MEDVNAELGIVQQELKLIKNKMAGVVKMGAFAWATHGASG